jgi:hypothetical protein
MLGLVLAVGIVIDDAVVVLENIFRRIQDEVESPMQAASRGTAEIALAVIATTLSLVIIFLPVAFMEGGSALLPQLRPDDRRRHHRLARHLVHADAGAVGAGAPPPSGGPGARRPRSIDGSKRRTAAARVVARTSMDHRGGLDSARPDVGARSSAWSGRRSSAGRSERGRDRDPGARGLHARETARTLDDVEHRLWGVAA